MKIHLYNSEHKHDKNVYLSSALDISAEMLNWSVFKNLILLRSYFSKRRFKM